MKLKHKIGLAAAFAALAIPVAVMGAGMWSTWSVIGGPAFCASIVTGTGNLGGITGQGQGAIGYICQTLVPAGPAALTGSELIPLDLNTGNTGTPVQSAVVPSGLLGQSTNRLIGGDLNTSLAQRLSTTKGIAALAGATIAPAIITSDGWWAYSTGSTATFTIPSGTTEVLPALNTTKALRVARPSAATPSGATCIGQTLDVNAASPLIGNNAVFSFYALTGATFSPVGGVLTAQIAYSSAADAVGTQAGMGYAGGNGSKFALAGSGQAGGPTNYTVATPVLSPATVGTVATTGVVSIPVSATWGRYSIAAPIPVNVPGTTTAVTNVSVQICGLFTATTSVTTDWFEVQGLQLEPASAVITTALPNGIVSPKAFERRYPALEAMLDYSYLYYNYEQQTLGLTANGSCENVATTTANCVVAYPVAMRIAPALQFTAGFQAFAQVAETSVSACTANSLSTSLASFSNNTGFLMLCTASVGAAGTANEWMSLGTSGSTGIISASAMP
jgi:hypothetical protein